MDKFIVIPYERIHIIHHHHQNIPNQYVAAAPAPAPAAAVPAVVAADVEKSKLWTKS